MTAALRVDDIHSYYGKSHILQGVSLEVGQGEIVTLLGRNGAGKSTTLKSIVGLVTPRSGRVELGGRDVTGQPAYRIASAGLSLVPEDRGIFQLLSVEENLRIAQTRGSRWSLGDVYRIFPRLEERRKKLPEFQSRNRRPIDRAFVRSIFTRDHPGTADDEVIEAFADAILALDDSVPTGTYVDMCAKLPVCDPERISAPTLIMRGEYDGIAGVDDLLEFFRRLPNPDKQFAVMPGIAHASFHQKNFRIAYHLLHGFFSQPAPIYRGR